MEKLLLNGKKEDMKLIANLAMRLGMTIEYVPDEDSYATINEPEALAEWGNLSKNQQQGLLDAVEDVKLNGGKKHEDVMKAMRKKYE